MTPQEALNELEDSIKGEGYQCHKEVYEMAISALEKQIPEKPGEDYLGTDGHAETPCGNCGDRIYKFWSYCPWCGQRIG